MFESLQQNLANALKQLRGRGKLTEKNIQDGLREVRKALLEADVNFQVVQDFIARITQQAIGQQVVKAIDPSQQIVKIVSDELIQLMGPVDHGFHLAPTGPTVIMLCGLQGSGKTTTSGKLALYLRERGRKPLLAAADLQRPAAIEQIRVLGQQLEIPVYSEAIDSNPVRICQNAVKTASEQGLDTVILDTAGRLHVDRALMEELELIDRRVQPHDVFLVCDAMTGQDAVASAKAFNETLTLNGVILTKLDGDARGGAALSVKAVTGVPIKFIGVGEKLDKLEEFHPERMAGRILGMGDIVSLVERAQTTIDQEEALRQQQKLAKGTFTLEDFRGQIGQMKKMGSMREIMGMIPGMDGALGQMPDLDEVDADSQVLQLQGIIDAMTPEERRNPDLIDQSRRRRIATGSGTDPADVNKLLKQFDAMRTMMKQLANMSFLGRMKALSGLGQSGLFNPGARLVKKKERSHRKTAKERAKERKGRRKNEKRRHKK